MTNPSHTELAARKLWETIKILGLQNEKLALQAIAAALESPERVQGEAYKLSDEDINEGAERHGITVAGPRLEDFDAGVRWAELVLANPPTAPAQDVHAQRNAQTLVDIGNAALRAGWNGVDMKAFVLARLATPSPQAEKQPLSEEQIVRCLQQASCIGTVKMSFESGPYDIDRPSINASRLVSAIEAAHGIVTKESTNG